MFAALPLLGLPVLFYTIFVLVSVGPPPDLAEAHVSQILFSIGMSSHVRWVVRVTDLFVFTSVVVLFIDPFLGHGDLVCGYIPGHMHI